MDYLPQFLILKDYDHETFFKSKNVFERNYGFFNDDEFKNELKDIAWNNIDLFSVRINTLLDEHAPKNKLFEKEISLRAKNH